MTQKYVYGTTFYHEKPTPSRNVAQIELPPEFLMEFLDLEGARVLRPCCRQ